MTTPQIRKRSFSISGVVRFICAVIGLPYIIIVARVFFEVHSGIKELSSFARGLFKDINAVENAVASPLSNGFVEGTNNKLKMVKRMMYGRCGVMLLRAKLMLEPKENRNFVVE